MHTARAAALLLIAGTAFSFAPSASAQNQIPNPNRAEPQRASDELLPIRAVTLYRSGVGGLLRAGQITGNANVSLQIAADDINDMLKSMTILDYGNGSVSAVTYDPADPLATTLSTFDIDLSKNPSIGDLLDQLRGQRISLQTREREFEAVVIGTEMRDIPAAERGEPNRRERFVSLLTSEGIASIPVNEIRFFEIQDENLAAELDRALATIAQRRTEDTKSVSLQLTGSNDAARDVAVFTIQEMPVWKMTYRLVLPDSPGSDPILQGYAIVENTTDADWENITLSLAAGRPVSFEMNLYEPLYLDRPDVPPPLLAAAAPKIFQAGKVAVGDPASYSPLSALRTPDETLAVSGTRFGLTRELGDERGRGSGGPALFDLAESNMSTDSSASAQSIGGQFFLTLDQPISVERRQSAMLPVVAGGIEAERVSIFNPSDQPNHPMTGVKLTNTADLTLLPGPITVFDGSAYAGDAQIPHIPVGSDQLLAYAVDLDVLAEVEKQNRSILDRIRIVNGAFEQRTTTTLFTTYSFTNRDRTRDRSILIEHQPAPGHELEKPDEPNERTSNYLRFAVDLAPGGGEELEVVETRVLSTRIGLTSMDLEQLLRYRAQGKVSQDVIEAVREANRLRAQVEDTRKRLESLEAEYSAIERDQQRIRENIARVGRDSDLYLTYAQKLDEQEKRIEQIEASRTELNRTLEDRERALTEYLRNLNVN